MRAVERDFRIILGARSFMTAMCVALDPQSGAGSIVGAGHPPLLVARYGGQTESIASTSPPLGLVAGSSFNETPVRLSGGDLFLLYTDGLYGAGESDQPRLAPALVAKQLLAAPGDAQPLLQNLLRELEPSPAGPVPPDDIAVLVVRRLDGKN
jgi:serine phosphatase RsbU (regulator of sigma subunit)